MGFFTGEDYKMPVELISEHEAVEPTTIVTLSADELEKGAIDFTDQEKNWIDQMAFRAKPGEVCLLPDGQGNVARVLCGKPSGNGALDAFAYARLTSKLPQGDYVFSAPLKNEKMISLALLLEGYRFRRYKESGSEKTLRFVVSELQAAEDAKRMAAATYKVRDLVNTPTNDMGPEQLSDAVKDLADTYGASFSAIVGDDLITQNFPMIHAVGRASDSAPRLLELKWGEKDAPKITLVGKGVCFDTGGLNIKTGNFMTLMKKDMGGAANVLGLAQMIMDANLPVRLRVLIPAVENSISGNAFRPGDVLPSRAGLSVEISNTDAEGRLVLADALAYADEENPDLLIDMATLTGAARVALGPDLPPFYCDDALFCDELAVRSKDMADPVWHMPLWSPYQSMLDTDIADVNHASSGGFAGSITAALFLSRFVRNAAIWAHFDIYAWTPSAKPGFPKGGEAQAIRALYGLLKARYPAG